MNNNIEEFAQNIEEYCQKFGEVFEDVYQEVTTELKDKLNDSKAIVDFLVAAMKAVSKHGELHGFDKKEMVRDVVDKVIDDMTIDEKEKDELKHNVSPYLDHTVEVLIAASKGHLFLKKVKDEIIESASDVYENTTGCGCFKNNNKKINKNTTRNVPIESGAVDDLGVIIYEKLRKMITTKHVTLNNIISIVGIVMQLIQQYPTLTGPQKKQIVKNVIYRLIKEIPISDADRLAVQGFLDGTLDKTIDYIIAVANGEIDLIGQVVEIVDNISEKCSGCCGKKQ